MGARGVGSGRAGSGEWARGECEVGARGVRSGRAGSRCAGSGSQEWARPVLPGPAPVEGRPPTPRASTEPCAPAVVPGPKCVRTGGSDRTPSPRRKRRLSAGCQVGPLDVPLPLSGGAQRRRCRWHRRWCYYCYRCHCRRAGRPGGRCRGRVDEHPVNVASPLGAPREAKGSGAGGDPRRLRLGPGAQRTQSCLDLL